MPRGRGRRAGGRTAGAYTAALCTCHYRKEWRVEFRRGVTGWIRGVERAGHRRMVGGFDSIRVMRNTLNASGCESSAVHSKRTLYRGQRQRRIQGCLRYAMRASVERTAGVGLMEEDWGQRKML